ncbi:lipase family protein [Chitinophaga sp. HK235]|uniref:lipase family protein n=1 Tax=Chitinophaga sp. HK235 TaxID=2952571 RepID=UPI001BAA1C0C|nr:lipase family protein [Chitinophaga sp. HK235]
MMSRILLFGFLFLFFGRNALTAQHLSPYFDAHEYSDMLKLSARQRDTPWTHLKGPVPEGYELAYRSEEVGLLNRWDFWINRSQGVGVISIRGTNGTASSWMENFYAGMVSAKGTLQLNDSTTFTYKLAEDNKAYVHAGWLLGLASMAPDIIDKINHYYYQEGIHEFIIFGHSQGGAIAFLLRSYLHYYEGMPNNIVFKTYCSAAPKPGNLYYSYDFDYITRNGWALRVVNAADWVPEVPYSIQTPRDFNTVNPFANIKKVFRKQKFPASTALRYAYGRLDRPARRASRRFQRMLGKMTYTRVKKTLPGYKRPVFVNSHNYMPAGTPVILYPVKGYDEQFHFDGKNIFLHHSLDSYRWLLEHIYLTGNL